MSAVIKEPKWLVDNLNHISDHGLAVEFSNPKLAAFINSLKRDGKIRLLAGQSRIDIHTIGRVTFTHLFLAHGSYNILNVHYLDEGANLRFTFKRNEYGELSENAYDTLKAVILGSPMPNNFLQSSRFGSGQDEMRSWLKKYAWSLAGENGLRAKAIEGIESRINSEINNLEYGIERKSLSIGQFDARDFDNEIVNARKRAKSIIEHNNKRETEFRNAYAKAQAEEFTEGWDVRSDSGGSYYNAPEHLRLLGMQRLNPCGQNKKLVMPSQGTTMSHPIHRPNYTATRDGDEIRLSSGIKCDVTAEQALNWLKGTGGTPETRYGLPIKIEAVTPEGLPIIIVKCGCHYLDLRNLGEDFTAALTPTHIVTVTGGKVEIQWSPENKDACLERMKENLDWNLKQFDDNKRAAAREFFEMRKFLIGLRDGKDQHMENMQRDEKELTDAKISKELELKNHPLLSLSGSLKQLNAAMITACNALVGIQA